MKTCPRCGELVGDSADKCFNCFFNLNSSKEEYRKAELERKNEEQRKIDEKNRIEQERSQKKAEELAQAHKAVASINDLYEYDVVSIVDSQTGGIDMNLLRTTLKIHGESGWRLVNSFTNEIGKTSHSHGMGGVSYSTNATIDETILIFERCVHRHDK